MNPFFTRTGDDGTTGVLGSRRVDKSDPQIELLGSLDELSAATGFARSLCVSQVKDDLKEIQIKIYEIMSEIAAAGENSQKFQRVNDETLCSLEKLIENYSQQTKIPNEFILPGDNSASAAVSMARTTARRAERRLVAFNHQQPGVRKILFQYLNRLSSFLYILEIYIVQNQADQALSLAKKKA
jgi:cob(I)alamin adenosyltransferase